jgi:hypothetical protein
VDLKTLKITLSEYVRLAAGSDGFWSPIVTVLLRKLVHLAPPGVRLLSTRFC